MLRRADFILYKHKYTIGIINNNLELKDYDTFLIGPVLSTQRQHCMHVFPLQYRQLPGVNSPFHLRERMLIGS